jgi:hypothetical protein
VNSELDLSDLEAAREELTAATMAVLEAVNEFDGLREKLVPAALRLGEVYGTLNRAIEACGRSAAEVGT